MPKAKSSKRIRLALVGASGRMGKNILNLLEEDSHFKKTYELIWAGDLQQKNQLQQLVLCSCDLLIDFSQPKASLLWLEAFKKAQKKTPPTLVGTTGFNKTELNRLKKLFSSRWALIPNTSLGVAALAQTLKTLSQKLGPEYIFSIWESHHAQKLDSPSGTALFLKKCIEDHSKRKVEVHAVRGGSDAGTHKIFISGPFEKIELAHLAQDRKLFAQGALSLGAKLLSTTSRSYPLSIEDLT
jgi:4-hydroxy-tetrahydrodipicolinate reductase